MAFNLGSLDCSLALQMVAGACGAHCTGPWPAFVCPEVTAKWEFTCRCPKLNGIGLIVKKKKSLQVSYVVLNDQYSFCDFMVKVLSVYFLKHCSFYFSN